MELTPEQVEALEAMEKAFGPTDALLHNVKSREYVEYEYGYVHWMKRSARELLISWGQYQHALTLPEPPSN